MNEGSDQIHVKIYYKKFAALVESIGNQCQYCIFLPLIATLDERNPCFALEEGFVDEPRTWSVNQCGGNVWCSPMTSGQRIACSVTPRGTVRRNSASSITSRSRPLQL